MFLERILEILRKNKYFTSARETLPKRAKQLETIVSLKKDVKFVDIWRNIEWNVKEMSASKQISRMFIMGKLPVNFLLLKPERFWEKKERILGRLIEKIHGSNSKPSISLPIQSKKLSNYILVNPEPEIKEESKEESKEIKEHKSNSKVQNKSIIAVMNEINNKNKIKFEQDMKEQQEKAKKKLIIQQKMGIIHPSIDSVSIQYAPYDDTNQQMYYNPENISGVYREYYPYMENDPNNYNPYQPEGIKSEYMNQPIHQQQINQIHPYAYDPRYPPRIIWNPNQLDQQSASKQTAPSNNEEGEEYDPLQNY